MTEPNAPTPYRQYARRAILSLQPYSPNAHAADSKAIKISANENDFGTPQAVRDAVMRAIKDEARLNRYPDSSCLKLRSALAEKHSLPADCFLVGNGLDDVLNMLGLAFLETGDEVVLPTMSFVVYENVVRMMDAKPVPVAMRSDFCIDLDATFSAIHERTKLVFLCSPNNPTGTSITKDEFEAFLQKISTLQTPPLLVMDHAYLDYQPNGPACFDAADYLGACPTMLVLRTFSKISALAGMRVGYAIGNPDLLAYIYRIRPPYTVNALAQAAAIADVSSPEVEAFKRQVSDAVSSLRLELESFLAASDIPYVPSRANFVFAFYDRTDGDLAALAAQLAARGILVRVLAHQHAPSGLRLSIGTPEENRALIEALRDILQA